MWLAYHVVNAFTRAPFGGNPAGVCPLAAWLPDALMQRIATESGLSETAFFVRAGDHYELRWFTPAAEVDLCGHATLASAHVLFARLGGGADRIEFRTRSGPLFVARQGERYALDLPAQPPSPSDPPPGLAAALGAEPEAVRANDDVLALLPSAAAVAALTPDFRALTGIPARGIIVTAPAGDADDCDFVSRFFAPAVGVDEDPVTGSAHCKLVPFWAERLGRSELRARQISARGGELFCRLRGERVEVVGHAADYLRGEIAVPEAASP